MRESLGDLPFAAQMNVLVFIYYAITFCFTQGADFYNRYTEAADPSLVKPPPFAYTIRKRLYLNVNYEAEQ